MSATPPPPPPLSRPPAASHSPVQSRLLARFPALQRLHVLHPSVPLPTLVVSFGVLHELTAILPVVGLFYGLRSVGGGQAVVDRMIAAERAVAGADARTVEGWLEEGERKAERVGRRYGLFGFPKTAKEGDGQGAEGLRATAGDLALPTTTTHATGSLPLSGKDLAGDVANAVAAYMLTKVRSELLASEPLSARRQSLTPLCTRSRCLALLRPSFLLGSPLLSISHRPLPRPFSYLSAGSGRPTSDGGHERLVAVSQPGWAGNLRCLLRTALALAGQLACARTALLVSCRAHLFIHRLCAELTYVLFFALAVWPCVQLPPVHSCLCVCQPVACDVSPCSARAHHLLQGSGV
jgi:hypothetical protein